MKSATLLHGLLLSSMFWLATSAHAATVSSSPSQVRMVSSYADYQSGDVIFKISSTVSGCEGSWLQPTDLGFKHTYATLLMAKAAQLNVIVYAYNNQTWPGSPTGTFCKVTLVSVE